MKLSVHHVSFNHLPWKNVDKMGDYKPAQDLAEIKGKTQWNLNRVRSV